MVHALAGTGAKLRRQVLYWAITLLLYAVCVLLLVVEVVSGVAAVQAVSWLVALIAIGALTFYVPVRASERLGLSPSMLAMAQAVYAIGCVVAAYAVTGRPAAARWPSCSSCWSSAPSR